MRRTFVGFGFGAIQAGLFLTEAYRSGNFDRLVVAEVLPDVVAAVGAAGGFAVNIGHTDAVETVVVQPVEICQPQEPAGRAALIAAVGEASEIATAVPSVDFYTRGGEAGIASLLAAGLRQKVAQRGPLAVIYTAENHTRAAELLEAAVLAALPAAETAAVLARVQFLDTIIGKMSGVPSELGELAPIAPGLPRAFLVEAFNRILITQIQRAEQTDGGGRDAEWAHYRRGIEVFIEKPDLRPFAEAKLYGHNAGHALAGYLGYLLGFTRIDELTARPDIVHLVRDAMAEESGIPLCRRYAGVDPLFTPGGFQAFADDLVVRMVNPFVRDTVARVARDPARKLGWDDRLVGAIRLAQDAGVFPWRYALGAAAALRWLMIPEASIQSFLAQLWAPAAPTAEAAYQVTTQIRAAAQWLRQWQASGFKPLEQADMTAAATDMAVAMAEIEL